MTSKANETGLYSITVTSTWSKPSSPDILYAHTLNSSTLHPHTHDSNFTNSKLSPTSDVFLINTITRYSC